MGRVVFSLFIEIADDSVDSCVSHFWSGGTDELERLRRGHEAYADCCRADYFFYDGRSSEFAGFAARFASKYPFLTQYEIINFFKIYMIYELADSYDELLYLDFDVIPFSRESFFDSVDLSRGLCLKNQTAKAMQMIEARGGVDKLAGPAAVSKRSTAAKYANSNAMLLEDGCGVHGSLFNTGVIGATRTGLMTMDYFGSEFDSTIDLMGRLKARATSYDDVASLFAYDNETVMSFLIGKRKLQPYELCDRYHFICKQRTFIPDETVLAHVIHKDFDHVWRQCPENVLRRGVQPHLLG